MRMFNADRSEGKMCGNGVRCVAKFVHDKGLTDKTTITLETLSGVKEIEMVVENGEVVGAKVDMGKPVFRATEIPMNCDHYIFVDQAIVLNDNHDDVTKEKVFYNGTAISMGNPHFVTFVDDVDSLNLEELGPQFEHHKLFPEGVNTEFGTGSGQEHCKVPRLGAWQRRNLGLRHWCERCYSSLHYAE